MTLKEYQALLVDGLKRIISQNDRLRLFTEFNPVALEAGGVHPEEFLHRLLVLGFRTFAILEEEKQLEEITESTQYNQYKKYLKNGKCNLLCVKSGEGY